MSKKKPEPIRVSAQGIEAKPITMNEPEQAIDWRELSTLPPFQMFICEKYPCPADTADLSRWAVTKAHDLITDTSSDDLYQRYAKWHEDKGYWPNETPQGEIKQ